MQGKFSLSDIVSLDQDAVLKKFGTSEHGLSFEDVNKRLKRDGHNILVAERKKHWVIEFLLNFRNPLVLILLFASIISFFLGEYIEGIIIAIIILFSTILNFLQEYHASKAAEKLKDTITTRTTVIRENKEHEVKIKNICIGDILSLSAGDIVPADARIIEAKDFFVNQASLTGESFPVEKIPGVVHAGRESLSEYSNCIFSGSSVIIGSAKAVVVKTGKQTEFGKIAEKLQEAPQQSEFTIGIKNFSLLIMRTTIFFVLFVFFFNTFFKHADLFESFTFAIAIAVGLTPELLPMIMSVTMAKGSLNMAKKGVIVKKLASIPDFGEMDILCTDKTGTLTEDKIELVTYTDVHGEHSESVLLHAYLNSYYQTGIKNPMDEAVIRFKKEGIEHVKKIDEIPFDFERKKMSVIVEKGEKHFIITKGAPEEIMKACISYEDGDKKKELRTSVKESITKQYETLSNEGYRVLSVAIKELGEKKKKYEKDDENELTFLGFIAFLDPAKKDVKAVLLELEKIGIEVKVITGDNELVTQKICRDVGIDIKNILLGHDIAKMSHEALRVAVKETTIFARCSPDQKSSIIDALKHAGYVVGYMGDGINDAPSLRIADVGISVNNAVDVAKESADMILTHKSLQELKGGVLEGRKTFGNTMKYIMMGISSNFGNMFSVLGAVLFLPFLPMLPIQILLNNMLYDISQISIPTDNVDEEYIQRPKKWDMKFIRNFMFVFGPISSLFDFLTFYLLFVVFRAAAPTFQTGWFLESLATQTLIIHIIRTRKIPFLQSRPSGLLMLTTFLVVAIGWILPYTAIGKYFDFVTLPIQVLITIIGIVVVYILCVELCKRLVFRYFAFEKISL